MFFELNEQDIQLLNEKGIQFDINHRYTEDEAFDLLEQVREVEIFYSQDSSDNKASYQKFIKYGDLADKIQNMIPEE